MTECPTPFKLRFPSRREARRAAIEIAERWAAAHRRKRAAVSSRCVYECACGGYHIATRRKERLRGGRGPEMADWLSRDEDGRWLVAGR
jgi:hypothetical protein